MSTQNQTDERREHVVDVLHHFLGKLFGGRQIPDDADLRVSGIDSLGAVELMTQLEDHYDVEIPPEEMDSMRAISVSELAELMCRIMPDRSLAAVAG
jgi:acyl carrier protein